MKRRSSWVAIIMAAAVTGGVGIAAASPHHGGGVRRIRVEEEQCTAMASACNAVDLGSSGPSQGDLLVFSVRLLNHERTAPVGRAIGHCTLTDTASGTYMCESVTTLRHGTITLEGLFHPGGVSRFAVTGGTGAYAGARGEFRLTAAIPTNHGVFELRR